MSNQAKYIVIEGTDGSGKQTQSKMLYDRLINDGFRVKQLSFPDYGSKGCAGVESYLSGEIEYTDYGPVSILFCADRIYTMNKYKEEFKDLDYVILDRYSTSNLLHQACKVDGWSNIDKAMDEINHIEYELAKLPKPDVVIFLDVPYDIAKEMRDERGRSDIHENDDEYMKNVHEKSVYIAMANDWTFLPENTYRTDVQGNKKLRSREDIHKAVYNEIKHRTFKSKEEKY